MGIARRKTGVGPPRQLAAEGLHRLLPWVKGARGFRMISYVVVAAAAILPALVWNSLSVPGTWREPGMTAYGPIMLAGGILVLEVAIILWVKMLQFGNERVWRRRERRAAQPPAEPVEMYRRATDIVAEPEPEPSAVPGVPRVLVVDDDPINRMILRKQLLRLNVEPVSAADGMEALEAVREGHWDLVLMDGQMPRLDGPETALEIRLRELLPADVPIVGISTDDTPEFRERCLKVGMQACYHKPVRRFVIEKLVDFYVRQRVAEEPDQILERALSDDAASS